MRAHELIDAALARRAMVVGSLPPDGRDLDLLVRPQEERALGLALSDAGFELRAGGWLRFAHCTVEQVELIPAGEWGLAPAPLTRLLEAGVPLPGAAQLVRPDPGHALLILARRLEGDGELALKHRRRVEQAVAEDPSAWEAAGTLAPTWQAQRALRDLRHAMSADATLSRPGLSGPGSPRPIRLLGRAPRAALRLGRAAARLARPRPVIALSGLDGAGKSSQARALADTLERLGYDATTAWTRMAWNDGFWERAVALKALLTRGLDLLGRRDAPNPADPRSGPQSPSDAASGHPGHAPPGTPGADPVGALRRRSALLTELWAGALALDNARAQRRLTRAPLRAGQVVICDRYTLDSIVSLRHLIDPRRRFGLQRRLLGVLSPRPLCAFLLDVAPETAWERKGEHGLAVLRAQRGLYAEEYPQLGVIRLDGERPAPELCAQIAREVWRALEGSSRS